MADLFRQWTPNRDDLAALSTEQLAQAMLGAQIVCTSPESATAGIIVEAEAYLGVNDRACHTFGGRKTPRLEALWLGPGHAYVYTIHMHWLLNITTQPEGVPQ